jgi:stage V sporulation protein R
MSANFLKSLEEWDEKIVKLASEYGLDWFPILYETCDYYEMIGNMAYHGMPTHYRHWSFGKSFERTHAMYDAGLEGLPYELIINSDPSLAYLMEENPLYLQVLIMCHCVGHSDFFKNNITFANTGPSHILLRMRNAKRFVDNLIEDPSIGVQKVEDILDAAHALSLQIPRRYKKYIPQKKQKVQLIKDIKDGKYEDADTTPSPRAIPVNPETNILAFLAECSPHLEDWERELVYFALEDAEYFMPQIRTKIMNEGWASFWHYKLMHDLQLPTSMHLPFLKTHNEVIKPHLGSINPYHLGFYLFKKIEERHGLEECFIAREALNDESFIRQYLIEEDCAELSLFTFGLKKKNYVIEDVSDEPGWKSVKENLIKQVSANNIPSITVERVDSANILCLKHDHEGRDLELEYAESVIEHITTLWGDVVKLDTFIEDEPFEI